MANMIMFRYNLTCIQGKYPGENVETNGCLTFESGKMIYIRHVNGTNGTQTIHIRIFFQNDNDCIKPISGPYHMLVKCCWQLG